MHVAIFFLVIDPKHNCWAAIMCETLSQGRLEIRSNPWPTGASSPRRRQETPRKQNVWEVSSEACWGNPCSESWRMAGSRRGGVGLQSRESSWYKAWAKSKVPGSLQESYTSRMMGLNQALSFLLQADQPYSLPHGILSQCRSWRHRKHTCL